MSEGAFERDLAEWMNDPTFSAAYRTRVLTAAIEGVSDQTLEERTADVLALTLLRAFDLAEARPDVRAHIRAALDQYRGSR